jgi:hypothetical protein
VKRNIKLTQYYPNLHRLGIINVRMTQTVGALAHLVSCDLPSAKSLDSHVLGWLKRRKVSLDINSMRSQDVEDFVGVLERFLEVYKVSGMKIIGVMTEECVKVLSRMVLRVASHQLKRLYFTHRSQAPLLRLFLPFLSNVVELQYKIEVSGDWKRMELFFAATGRLQRLTDLSLDITSINPNENVANLLHLIDVVIGRCQNVIQVGVHGDFQRLLDAEINLLISTNDKIKPDYHPIVTYASRLFFDGDGGRGMNVWEILARRGSVAAFRLLVSGLLDDDDRFSSCVRDLLRGIIANKTSTDQDIVAILKCLKHLGFDIGVMIGNQFFPCAIIVARPSVAIVDYIAAEGRRHNFWNQTRSVLWYLCESSKSDPRFITFIDYVGQKWSEFVTDGVSEGFFGLWRERDDTNSSLLHCVKNETMLNLVLEDIGLVKFTRNFAGLTPLSTLPRRLLRSIVGHLLERGVANEQDLDDSIRHLVLQRLWDECWELVLKRRGVNGAMLRLVLFSVFKPEVAQRYDSTVRTSWLSRTFETAVSMRGASAMVAQMIATLTSQCVQDLVRNASDSINVASMCSPQSVLLATSLMSASATAFALQRL